jgi:hypothetical protein
MFELRRDEHTTATGNFEVGVAVDGVITFIVKPMKIRAVSIPPESFKPELTIFIIREDDTVDGVDEEVDGLLRQT